MHKIKKNDIVQVMKGKDRGKKGKVISLIEDASRAIVEGLNLAKKHKRQTSQDKKGGIISIEMSMSVSNLMLVCKGCNKAVRVGVSVSKDGVKSRICKACKEVI